MKQFKQLCGAVAMTFVAYTSGFAADAVWTNDPSSTWISGTNWDTGIAPGATSGTTSPDTATFYATALTGNRVVTVDTGRNIANMVFTNSTSGFTLQLTGGSLLLSAGGRIELISTALANVQTFINSPITLEGNYTFLNNGGNAAPTANPLEFQGSATISGAPSLGAVTLTLGGTNGNLAGKALISSIISNGTGNTLGIVKQDAGNWQLNGANTFSGGLVIKAGGILIGNSSGLGGSGTGAVTLGDSVAGQDALLDLGSNVNAPNPLQVSGGAGSRRLSYNGGSGNSTYSGSITLNHDLLVQSITGNSARTFTLSGGIGGAGSIILSNAAVAAANTVTLSGSITNVGGITNVGFLGDVVISGAIGTNVAGVVQNSATSFMTISGAANTYTANTIISAGTLKLGATASIATSTSINVASGAIFDVSGVTGGFTLANGQTLLGQGNLNGNVVAGSGSKISPENNAVAGAITFNNNLNMSGGSLILDVSTSSSGGNDSVQVSGTLTASGSVVLRALSGAANLDTSADYVLVNAGSISGTFASTPTWTGTQPANAANFSIVTTASQVLLRYTPSVPPTVTASATPSIAVRGQSFNISTTVTPGSSPVSTVTVDMTFIGGSASANLVSAGGNVYTNRFTVGSSSSLGNTTLAVVATDANALQGSFGVPFTVQVSLETWNGAGANNNWSTAANWTNGAPPLNSDLVFFDGATRTSPNVDAAYNIAGLTFNSGAAGFNIGTSSGGTLTLTGGVTNNSANPQTISVPLALNGTEPLPINASAGNITVSGAVSDSAFGLIKLGSGTLTLAAVNTYTGPTVVSNGTVAISGAGNLGSGADLIVANGSTLNLGGSSQSVNVMTAALGTIGNGTLTATDYELQGGTVSVNLTGSGIAAHKSTTNALVLTGNNTFDGGFVISNASAGLCVNSPTALGIGAVDISQGGNGGSFDCTAITAISNANNNALSLSGDFTFVGSQSLNLGNGNANMGTFFPKTITVLSNTLEFAGNIYSGGTQPLTKAGAGRLILSGNSTYFGATAVNGGTLLVNGSLDASGGTVAVANTATLGGSGTINRPVIVNAGGTLSPGTGIGTLTINSDLTNSGNLFIEVNKALTVSNDTVVVSGLLTNAGTGTVTITNLNPSQPLGLGDSFKLFSQPLLNGGALTISPVPGAGLAWTNRLAVDGTVAVVAGVATNPTNVTASVSGNKLTLSWPSDHAGWTLQVQTNSLSTGLGTNWVDVSGSTVTNSIDVPIVTTNGAVFYRLKL